MNIDVKFEARTNIKFFLVKLNVNIDIIKVITGVYGDNTPKKTNIYE